jgi:hypothetical protein
MEYPKIHSLWKRDALTNKIIEGEYSRSEFESQKLWRVQEKIDGTNVRITVTSCEGNVHIILYEGRTRKAVLHPKLVAHLQAIDFTPFAKAFPSSQAILFGEGFGAGIQSGGIYRPDRSFILFDIYFQGQWATRDDVSNIAKLLNLETPHDYGLMTQEEIISFVKSKPHGEYGNKKYITEGIIARSEPLVRFNTQSAHPVMWKLKVKDFIKGDK